MSQKKVGFLFKAHFRGLNDQKSKNGRKDTPIKFYLLEGVFSPVYTCISSTGLATVQNQILNIFIIPFFNHLYSGKLHNNVLNGGRILLLVEFYHGAVEFYHHV